MPRHLDKKRAKVYLLPRMSELIFKPILPKLTCTFSGQTFSTMYFGRHFGKNILILNHDLTILLIFEGENQCSTPEIIKSVTFREGNDVKGVQIIGSKDIIMLDENGKLWRMINAFEMKSKGNGCLHSFNDSCYYQWIPFHLFKFNRILALCAMKEGFVFLGLTADFKRKLSFLPSLDSNIGKEIPFEEINESTSLDFHLISINLNIENSIFKNKFESGEELLLLTDQLSGKSYLCNTKGRSYCVNQSNIRLISVLNYPVGNCLVFCYQNGKLVFYFYDKIQSYNICFLLKEIVFIEKCFCNENCMLWSDGNNLNHTRFSLDCKLCNLEVKFSIESPLSIILMNNQALTVSVNNIYYLITNGVKPAVEIQKQPKELLLEMSKLSEIVVDYETEIKALTHYLSCKQIAQSNKIKEKIKMKWEGNCLVIKSFLEVCLKQEFWKIQLKTSIQGKEFVHLINLDCDLTEGRFVSIKNPFKAKYKVKGSLIGDFGEKSLFFDLGEVEALENDYEKLCFKKELEKILDTKKQNQ